MQLKHARWLGLNDIGTQSCQTVEDIWRKKHLPNPALHRFIEGSGRWGILRVSKNFSNLLLPTIYCILPRAIPPLHRLRGRRGGRSALATKWDRYRLELGIAPRGNVAMKVLPLPTPSLRIDIWPPWSSLQSLCNDRKDVAPFGPYILNDDPSVEEEREQAGLHCPHPI